MRSTSATDYYPGGMPMPGRQFSSDKYRFGFNGKENDNEVKGQGNSVAFEARIYDPRTMRFNSLDPLMKKYPSESNYTFAGNSPIMYVDQEGKKKTYYITFIDIDGKVTKFRIVDKNDVRLGSVRIGHHSDGMGGSIPDLRVEALDVTQNIVVDARNQSITRCKELFTSSSQDYSALVDVFHRQAV